ncbi:MAG: isochorismatase [Chloroflexi bacterium]|nr:isochorismatase [Chloroflexota bacterium]
MPFWPLPLPPHFDPQQVGRLWKVDYAARFADARAWAQQHGLKPASQDRPRIALVLIDVQNAFCLPDFELFVAGRSGHAAVDDNRRLVAFIYRHLAILTHILLTLDTHLPMQIFHPPFWIDAQGQHPAAFTQITAEDVEAGRWRFNPALAATLGLTPEQARQYVRHYLRTLEARGKYRHTIWPFHALLGGLGHALVPAVEEAVFFHSVARYAQPRFVLKGSHPLTEHYSALQPEVNTDAQGRSLVRPNEALVDVVRNYDAVILTGQAKSHCVAWTVNDLLDQLEARDLGYLAGRIYLLEDTTSPIVTPEADFTAAAQAAYARFVLRGAHRVTTEQPLDAWPDFPRTAR